MACFLLTLTASVQADWPPPGILRTVAVPETDWAHVPLPFHPTGDLVHLALDGQGAAHAFQVNRWEGTTQTWRTVTHTPGIGWTGDNIALEAAHPLMISHQAPLSEEPLRLSIGGVLPDQPLLRPLVPGLNRLSSPQLSPRSLRAWTVSTQADPDARLPGGDKVYGRGNATMAWLKDEDGKPVWTGADGKDPELLQPTLGYFYELPGNKTFWVLGDVKAGYDAAILPAVRQVRVDAQRNCVVLTIETPAGPRKVLDVFYRDVNLPADESETGWRLLGRGLVAGEGSTHELDDVGVSDSDRAGASDVRLYQVTDGAQDSDADGLSDGMEELVTQTDPLNPDADQDGLLDGDEYERGTDFSHGDTDRDGMLDGEEIARGHNPLRKDHPDVEFRVFTPLR
jgi:hypothetical protein